MKPGTRHKIEVSFELNEQVSMPALRDFVISALENWGGQFHPDDPLFGSLEKVRIKLIKAQKP